MGCSKKQVEKHTGKTNVSHPLALNQRSTEGQAKTSNPYSRGERGNKSKLLQDLVCETARKPQDQNASSNGISYENTLLVKHNDDAAPFTHWNKSNDQTRDELRFQSRFLHNKEAMKSNESQYSIFERAREKRTKAINRERNRDSSRSDAIKTLILNQPTTDSTIALKTGYRQVTFIGFRFTRL